MKESLMNCVEGFPLHESTSNSFESRFMIGANVVLFGKVAGVVVAVKFTISKVTYDVDPDMGGLVLHNIDSAFVEPNTEEI